MRILLWILAAVTGLFLLTALALYLLVDGERLRPQLEASLSVAMARPVTIGDVDLSLLRFTFAARALRIGEDAAFGEQAFVEAEALNLRVAILPLLLERRLHVRELRFDRPRVRLIQNRRGGWNFATLAGPRDTEVEAGAALPDLRIDRLRLNDGSLIVLRPGQPPMEYAGLNLEVDDLDLSQAVPFRFSVRPAAGGRLALAGRLGPVDAGDVAATPIEAGIELSGLDLARMQTETDGAGTGLAGTLDFDGQARIAAGRLTSEGQARVTALRLLETGAPAPQPTRLDYRFDYDLNGRRGRLGDSRLSLGNAALSLSGGIDNRGKAPKIDLSLSGKGLPIDDVQALLPMLAIVLPERSRLQGGQLDLDLKIAGEPDALSVVGPVRLSDTRLTGFSIGQRMGQAMAVAGLRAPADTVVRSASTELRIDLSGTRMDRIQAEIAEFGSLTGSGRIGADESLDFRFVARLAEEAIGDSGLGGRLGGALQAALSRGRGDGIGLRVTGTAAEPAYAVDTASLTRLGASAVLGAALTGDAGDPDSSALDGKQATEALKQKAVESLFKRLGGKDRKQDEDGD